MSVEARYERLARAMVQHHGEELTFRPANGAPAQEFRGVFSSAYLEVAPGGVPVASANPRIGFVASDLTGTLDGGRVTRGTVNYTVVGVEPDSPSGLTELQLEKA